MIAQNKANTYWRLSALSAGSALIVAFLFLLGHRWYSDRDQLVDHVAVQASIIGANASAALAFDDAASAREILSAMVRSPVVRETALYRSNRTLIARFRADDARNDEAQLTDSAPPLGVELGLRSVSLVEAVKLEGRSIGFIALRATLDGVYLDLGQFFGSLVVITLVSAALAHLVSRRLRRRMADAEIALQRLALIDRVTGLANRYAFENSLNQAVRRHMRDGKSSALLFIDVDGFKKVNDRFGHSAGDQVLVQLGQRLSKCVRAADVVARLGGDEFAVILTDNASPDDAARVAGNLIEAAARPLAVGDQTAHVGFSIGIAMIPQDGDSVEQLMHRADVAMYHAKQSGKGNRKFFSEAIGASVHRRLEIEAELRVALREGQLHVIYQPQVDAVGGALHGLEALVQWRHPQRGEVAPREFIPVAEESELIVELGNWVLGRVCQDIVALRGSGRTVPPVAVNVSARQLARMQLVDEIAALLSAHGLSAHDLEIELTESLVMDRPAVHEQVLAALDKSGVRIAIDDFGTGYSSLSYLRRLPVCTLKIDMSFVHDLPDDAESIAIIGGIIGMTRALGIRTVAEGVETEAQAECLRRCGCDGLQGYHTGRPMDIAALGLLLAQRPMPT